MCTVECRRNFRRRKLENETGTDRGVVFDAEKPVVFGDDAGSDGEAESGAAIFGGEMREEEFVLIGWRDAVAGVCDGDFDGIGFGIEAGCHVNVSNRSRFEGFGGIVNEIDDDTAEKASVGANSGKRFREKTGEHDAVETTGKNFEGFADDVVGASGFEFGCGEADELREFVDEGSERADFAFDEVR